MSRNTLNILILHGMGPRSQWLAGVADVELMFPRYSTEHRYLVHNAYYPIPSFVKEIPYDVVLVSSTFMDRLTNAFGYDKFLKEYSFLIDNPAIKIAFPQDDYWCSEVRDEWFTSMRFDKIYPVCSEENWPVLFPKFIKTCRNMSIGFTTYVTPYLRDRTKHPRPWDMRTYDVIYRAKGRPTYPNKLGVTKAVIGERFKRNIGNNSLKMNISTDPKHTIFGDHWYDFVEDARAILGSNSGSSVLVRNHKVNQTIKEYLTKHPDATFEQIEDACFTLDDRKHNFTAISPRNIEAGLLCTLQILVPGLYSGILEPWKQYVPLSEDCSNIDEVLDCLKSRNQSLEIADRCRKRILESSEIQVETIINETFSFIYNHLNDNHISIDPKDFDIIVNRHHKLMTIYELIYYPYQLTRSLAKRILYS